MDQKTVKSYQQRFNHVLDYIDNHLYENLSVSELSEVAHFSKYHFVRQFSEHMGISVFSYIRLMRLKRASYRLAINAGEKIIDIALDTGFENPESFSRAFKNTFGQSPSQFRQAPKWQPWREKYQLPTLERNTQMNVEIVNFAETKVGLLEHRASPMLIEESVMKLIQWRKESGLSPVKTSKTLGIIYDDPEHTEAEKFHFDICAEVKIDIPPNLQGLKNSLIPMGRCATTRHLGSHRNIGQSTSALYRDWLPNSGEELRDFPLFFHYINLMPEVEENELITDIYLPLK